MTTGDGVAAGEDVATTSESFGSSVAVAVASIDVAVDVEESVTVVVDAVEVVNKGDAVLSVELGDDVVRNVAVASSATSVEVTVPVSVGVEVGLVVVVVLSDCGVLSPSVLSVVFAGKKVARTFGICCPTVSTVGTKTSVTFWGVVPLDEGAFGESRFEFVELEDCQSGRKTLLIVL